MTTSAPSISRDVGSDSPAATRALRWMKSRRVVGSEGFRVMAMITGVFVSSARRISGRCKLATLAAPASIDAGATGIGKVSSRGGRTVKGTFPRSAAPNPARSVDLPRAPSVGEVGAARRSARRRLASLYIHGYIYVRFAWDPLKSERNFQERGIDFALAAMIFPPAAGSPSSTPTAATPDKSSDASFQRGRAAAVSAKRTRPSTRKKRTDSRPRVGRVTLGRAGRARDEEIERTSPPELANLPYDFWDDAVMVSPAGKTLISLRVDADVLFWFRAQGPRYQSRMNAVLRSYMERMRRQPRS